jgi:hypothetical protein
MISLDLIEAQYALKDSQDKKCKKCSDFSKWD